MTMQWIALHLSYPMFPLFDQDWRTLMQPARDVAAGMVQEGLIEVTQKGAVVDIGSARGPVRLRLKS